MPVTPTATPPVARRRSATTETIDITVRPLYGESRVITVPANTPVSTLLEEGGYPSTAEVRLIADGTASVLTADSILENGDVIQLVSGKKITNGDDVTPPAEAETTEDEEKEADATPTPPTLEGEGTEAEANGAATTPEVPSEV